MFTIIGFVTKEKNDQPDKRYTEQGLEVSRIQELLLPWRAGEHHPPAHDVFTAPELSEPVV